MTQDELIKVDEKNNLYLSKITKAIREILPDGELPKEVQAVLTKTKFNEARNGEITELLATFPNDQKAIGSILIQNAIVGLVYNEDYWITPRDKKPLFQFQASGYTKLLQTHSTPAYKLEKYPLRVGVIYHGEEIKQCNINGVISHIMNPTKRTNQIKDIQGAYAQYKTNSGDTIYYYLSKDEIDNIISLSKGKNTPLSHYSPWLKWPEKMVKVKAIKGLCKDVKHSGGFDFSKAIMNYLSQDEMNIDADGNPIKPQPHTHTPLNIEQLQEVERLCEMNQLNCKQVMNTYNLNTFMEANQEDYLEIKEKLTIKEIKQND